MEMLYGMIDFLDYGGMFCIILAAYIFTSKKAYSAKYRRMAITFYLISNGLWIPMAIILMIPGLLISQVILLLINIKGMKNVLRELKTINENERKKRDFYK